MSAVLTGVGGLEGRRPHPPTSQGPNSHNYIIPLSTDANANPATTVGGLNATAGYFLTITGIFKT